MRAPLLWAGGVFLVWCVVHWAALPMLITFDSHQYLDTAKLFGSSDFRAEWPALRMPGFSVVLAAAFALFGRNALAAQSVTVLAGAAGCVLIADAVRRIAGTGAAAATLVVLGFFPTLVGFEHIILTETGTFFFLAVMVRLGVWTPVTATAAWGRAAAFGVALTAAYLWRQTLLAAAPIAVALVALAAFQVAPRAHRARRALLQCGIVVVLPLLAHTVWWSYFPVTTLSGRLLLVYPLAQGLIPPDDPAAAPVAEEYRAALDAARARGNLGGLSWSDVDSFGRRMPLAESPTEAIGMLAGHIGRHPLRYLHGVGRTLLFFSGVDSARAEGTGLRNQVFAAASGATMVSERPLESAERNRVDFARTTPAAPVRRALRGLTRIYDPALPVASLATIALCLLALYQRDPRGFALAGVPLLYTGTHAALLISMDRFAVPTYPILLACAVVVVWRLAGRWLDAP